MAEIRLLTPDDAPLLEAADGVFDDSIVAASARAFLHDDRHHLVVAIDGGRIVGFASALLYVHPDKPGPELWINEVGVVESARRRGLARAMLEHLLAHAAALGCSEAWVLSDPDNAPAAALYASLPDVRREPATMWTFPLPGDGPRT